MVTVENTPRAWSDRAAAGTSWEAAGWSEHGQVQRFLAVRKHLDFRDNETVLDYGCGTGAFCEYLPRDVRYFGFDTAEMMRDRCAAEHERATVLDSRHDCTFDHVVAIGPFNLPGSFTETAVELHELWARARRSLMVTLYRGTDPRCVIYAPEEVTEFAAKLSSRFLLDCSYLDNDMLLVLRR